MVEPKLGGAHGLFLHLPFSTGPGRLMEYSAMDRVESMQRRGIMPRSDYSAESLELELSRFMYRTSAKVICYLGSITEPEMQERLPRPSDWMAAALRAVSPILRAATAAGAVGRLSIGIDSLGAHLEPGNVNSPPRVGPDSPEFQFLKLVQSLGVPVLCEPHPSKRADFDHLRQFGAVATDDLWKAAHLRQQTGIAGEVVLIDPNNNADLERIANSQNVSSVAVTHGRVSEAVQIMAGGANGGLR